MQHALRIATEEWRLWRRSRLALASGVLFLALLAITAMVTTGKILHEREHRTTTQMTAEETFRAQPDRHPHRMVHYGHYVFRTPPPLAVLDPGLLPVTGGQLFLEGHRQNTPMIEAADADAGLGGLPPWTPALCYQLFAPLLLILLGYGVVVRERETGTLATLLAQGVSPAQLLLGKFLSLLSVSALLLLPALLVGVFSLTAGSSPAALLLLLLSYLAYLSLWSAAIVFASAVFERRNTVLNGLLTIWLVSTLIVPALGVNLGSSLEGTQGKIELDLAMHAEMLAAGDAHNANDPAFVQLRSELLAQYGVDDVAELPVNIRGVVSEQGEAAQTEILNRYADRRLGQEQASAEAIRRFGWLSPTLALGFASRALAGTDLVTHHRFQLAAEALRFEFVQGLNRVHAEELDYTTDIERNSGAAASRRARVSAANWAVLNDFSFEAAPFADRIAMAGPALAMLIIWFAAALFALRLAQSRLAL
ncbi:MAG: DUF3526 domain-containing protein [Pseudomonadota bacterium]